MTRAHTYILLLLPGACFNKNKSHKPAFNLFMTWTSNYIHIRLWGVLTHPCLKFGDGLVKPPSKLGREWVSSSHIQQWMWSFIYSLISVIIVVIVKGVPGDGHPVPSETSHNNAVIIKWHASWDIQWLPCTDGISLQLYLARKGMIFGYACTSKPVGHVTYHKMLQDIPANISYNNNVMTAHKRRDDVVLTQ